MKKRLLLIFGVALSLAFATYNISVIGSTKSAVVNMTLAKSVAIANGESGGNTNGCYTVRDAQRLTWYLYITYACIKGEDNECAEGSEAWREYELDWEFCYANILIGPCENFSCCE